jgi:integrase
MARRAWRWLAHKELEMPFASLRAEKSHRLPTVLSKEETRQVLTQMTGVPGLMARLLYGCGLRLQECVELRVKDIDFDQRQIIVRDGKGMEDRVTILPDSLIVPLKTQLRQVKRPHEQDLAHGHGAAPLPFALARKYPNADREWGWQYVFRSARLAMDAETGEVRWWYMSPSTLQKAVRQAAKAAGITKPVAHTPSATASGARSGVWSIRHWMWLATRGGPSHPGDPADQAAPGRSASRGHERVVRERPTPKRRTFRKDEQG